MGNIFSTVIGAFVIAYVVTFLVVLAAVKRGKGILMKFCGADFYTFDVKKRMARVSKISLIAGGVVAAISLRAALGF